MSDRDVVNTTKKWVIIAILATIVLSLGGWGLKVLLSGPKGRGDQIIQNNSNQNRTEQQQAFEDRFAAIKALDLKIGIAQQAIDTDTKAGKDTTIDQQNLIGVENVCVSAVTEYDANGHKVLAQDWRTPDLPQQINQQDPKTDCKPNA